MRGIEEMEGAGHWFARGLSNVGEIAEKYGLSARIAFQLVRLRRVLRAAPGLENEILEGKYNFELVAALLPFVEDSTLLDEGETLESMLVHRTTRQLHRLARRRRIEKGKTQERHPVSLELTDEGKADLDHASQILSQQKQEPLTYSETVAIALRDSIEARDPLEKVPRARRMEDTDGKPGRGTAQEVIRWFLKTYGRKCLCWWCDHDLLKQRAHIKSKHLLGGQEAANLIPPCTRHHKLFDLGFLILLASGGKRYLADRWGELLGEIIEPPPELAPPDGGRSLFEKPDPQESAA
jgi:hypothetical protein